MQEDQEAPQTGQDIQGRELEIVTHILTEFRALPQASRRRVIDTVSKFFDLRIDGIARLVSSSGNSSTADQASGSAPSFSEDRSIKPKQFMFQKQPKTDVEKVACLAYYLTHYRDTPHFKTLDISKLNTEAAQVKFSNAAVAVDNATKLRYLVPATKGNKQLGALGEQFVLALPDREKAKELMNGARPRRRGKRNNTEPL